MSENRIGHLLTPELLDELAKLFPSRCPNLKDSEREVWYHAGQASVAEVLRTKYEAAQEDADGFGRVTGTQRYLVG